MIIIGGLSISDARKSARVEVMSLFDSSKFDYGFFLVFNTHFFSILHRFKVTRLHVFLLSGYSGMSFSTARGRLRPEVKSPVDWTLWFSIYVSATLHLFGAISGFLFAENGGMTGKRWNTRPERCHSLIPWPQFAVGWPKEFFFCLAVQTFDFELHWKCPVKISPLKKVFFVDLTSLNSPRPLRYKVSKLVEPFDLYA